MRKGSVQSSYRAKERERRKKGRYNWICLSDILDTSHLLQSTVATPSPPKRIPGVGKKRKKRNMSQLEEKQQHISDSVSQSEARDSTSKT
jgi:hypothetical protein